MNDWDGIEQAFRFSSKSNRAIAKEFGVSEGAIRKRAAAEGWEKGVAAGVRQPRPELEDAGRTSPAPAPAGGNRDALSAIDRSIDLAHRMLDELDAATCAIGELEELIYTETEDDRDGRRRAALLRATSISTRTTALKTIQQSLDALQILQAKQSGGLKGDGKKAERAAAARQAVGGRFAPAPPPLSVIKGGRPG